MAWPAFADAGTSTEMNESLDFGCGTCMVVPAAPSGTLMQVVGPLGTIGAAGGFHLWGARISRSFPDPVFFCVIALKSTWYNCPRSLYLAFGKPARKARL